MSLNPTCAPTPPPLEHTSPPLSPNATPPPPDGGYGWICVISQFFINGFTWGVVASYSVYLAYYPSHNLFPDSSPLDFAFIGGFNFAFALLIAPIATLLTKLYGVRTPMLLGIILLPSSFIGASFATKIWHLYLAQGMGIGVAVGLIYIPATAIIPQWFLKKRSLASGICSAGSGIGGHIICFATEAMLQNVGLVWSLRITAAVVFVVNLVATLLMRSRDEEIRPNERMFNFRLWRSYEVRLLLGWSFVLMFGYIVLMFSLSDYAIAIGRSNSDSAVVAAVLNLGAADRYGRVEIAGTLTFVCGVLVFVMWVPATTFSVLVTFAFLSGAILGVFWATIAPLAADVVGLKELPAFLSIIWLSVVLPTVFAEAIALKLRRPGLGARSYLHAQVFTGLSYILASFLLFELGRFRRNAVSH
ncbi:MFS general substrate transporter [Mollisia scopiformis]|uniref:MFS general substrate transporter n=1 Tax=Mollisia scopiformis TaxID=149040 RepID=A0A194WSZ6_MOLSC|nr:MFS general substrate transporter [Mollisia scopiformis]KUJ11078.1 MFS general substrate transporter [Mollisia scopiformis]